MHLEHKKLSNVIKLGENLPPGSLFLFLQNMNKNFNVKVNSTIDKPTISKGTSNEIGMKRKEKVEREKRRKKVLLNY